MLTSVEFPLDKKRVWVAGHSGMVGSAIVRRLEHENCEIITIDRGKVDLREQTSTRSWVLDNKPDVVFLAAAKVGGILANDSYPADFLYDNLMIEANVLDSALRADVSKVLFLGSSCIYPKLAAQPIIEDALLTGALEPTNEWYAIAKIAGIKLCQSYRRQFGRDFISAMPTNLYGPGDNFDLTTSHVIPALIHKAHAAKLADDEELRIWGTGAPRREFLHVDDCAAALVHLMKCYSDDQHVNVGSGEDITILSLATIIADVVGFKGTISCDLTKPDGTLRKLLDVSKLRSLGWQSTIKLNEGLKETYRWFVSNLH